MTSAFLSLRASRYDEVVNEPLPERLVDLINYLNAKEGVQQKISRSQN
jgi:Anti-sigma factor NepR